MDEARSAPDTGCVGPSGFGSHELRGALLAPGTVL